MRKLSELWEGISKWIELWEGMRKWTELWEGMRMYMKELWYELVVNGVACNHEFLLTFLWFVNLKHVHVFLCHLPHLGLFNT